MEKVKAYYKGREYKGKAMLFEGVLCALLPDPDRAWCGMRSVYRYSELNVLTDASGKVIKTEEGIDVEIV